MTLDVPRLATAAAIVAAVSWSVCSASVALFPDTTLAITGHMVHADLSAARWSLTWAGFATGLVAWVGTAAALAALLAWSHNALGRRTPRA